MNNIKYGFKVLFTSLVLSIFVFIPRYIPISRASTVHLDTLDQIDRNCVFSSETKLFISCGAFIVPPSLLAEAAHNVELFNSEIEKYSLLPNFKVDLLNHSITGYPVMESHGLLNSITPSYAEGDTWCTNHGGANNWVECHFSQSFLNRADIVANIAVLLPIVGTAPFVAAQILKLISGGIKGGIWVNLNGHEVDCNQMPDPCYKGDIQYYVESWGWQ